MATVRSDISLDLHELSGLVAQDLSSSELVELKTLAVPSVAALQHTSTTTAAAATAAAATITTTASRSLSTPELDGALQGIFNTPGYAEWVQAACASSSTAAGNLFTGDSSHGPAEANPQIPFEMSSPQMASEMTAGQQRVTLQEAFVTHVMCDYTPRSPNELPMSKWTSCNRLLSQLQAHAPSAEALQLTADQLKQQITEWFQDHPAYSGLSFNEWGKRLKDNEKTGARGKVFKFSFEHTPAEAETLGWRRRGRRWTRTAY